MTLLIKNARAYLGGKIQKEMCLLWIQYCFCQQLVSENGADCVFDFQNKYLLIPGFVDAHVHLREPGFSYKETIKTGSLAAAVSGYNAVCPMPNLNPAPDCAENLRQELDIIKRDAVIDVLPFAR
jgi:dihydroorotase